MARKSKIKPQDYPDRISIIKMTNGKFKYSLFYKSENLKLECFKSYKSPLQAWKYANIAIKHKFEQTMNFI